MVTVGSVIDKLQSYDPSETVENLLQEPQFVADLTTSFKSLPKTSRAVASKIVRTRRPAAKVINKSDKALQAVQSIESIKLPSIVQHKYSQCKARPSQFWVLVGIQLDLNDTKPIGDFLSEAYLGIGRLEAQRVWDTITWRFFVLFYYDLICLFGRKYLTASLENELAATLSSSPSITHAPDVVKDNLRRWVSCGLRYAELSSALDDGAPFLLPQSVTDRTWEHGLPMSGPIHKKAIKHIVEKGYNEESRALGAASVGKAIREAIIRRFQLALGLNTTYAPPYLRAQTIQGRGGPRGHSAQAAPEVSPQGSPNQSTLEAPAARAPRDESTTAMDMLSTLALSPAGTLNPYALHSEQTSAQNHQMAISYGQSSQSNDTPIPTTARDVAQHHSTIHDARSNIQPTLTIYPVNHNGAEYNCEPAWQELDTSPWIRQAQMNLDCGGSPDVFIADHSADGIGGEQLIRKDLLPMIDLESSWDPPGSREFENLPLFNAQGHYE